MPESRSKRAYLFVLPIPVLAAGVLGYYSYLSAAQFEQLGAESIAEQSVLVLDDRVHEIDRRIVSADNRAFRFAELADAETAVARWRQLAAEETPSIRAMAVLDERAAVVAFDARVKSESLDATRELLVERVVPELDLPSLRPGLLKHLHRRYDGKSYLVSYMALLRHGRRGYALVEHDLGFLVRELFTEVLGPAESPPWYNVVDEDNQRVYGPSLAQAGDYVVGRRFPTTLYLWRLQVAPSAAGELQAKGRTSRFNQVALIGLSFAIIMVAVVFLLVAADKERRLASLKSDFIATVSHELKTPLSVIRMFGEMLLTDRVRDARKRQEYLEIICSETERLSGLIENVLDFAALERGKRKYEMREHDVAEIAERALEALRYRFEREHARVELVRTGEKATALVDDQAILLVAVNLLDNAMKYAPGGPVEMTVATTEAEIQLRVRDHGPGIPPADLKRVFDRFYRTKGSERARGSGIGLAIVKRIAEEHAGRAWAENVPEGGALVAISIPRRRTTHSSRPTPTGSERPDRHSIDTPLPADIVARHG